MQAYYVIEFIGDTTQLTYHTSTKHHKHRQDYISHFLKLAFITFSSLSTMHIFPHHGAPGCYDVAVLYDDLRGILNLVEHLRLPIEKSN